MKSLIRFDSRLVVSLIIVVSTFVIADGQQPRITVSPNVQVSVDNKNKDHDEVLMGADPADPKRLIGCSMLFPDPLARRITDSVTYQSEDGGLHWKQTLYVDKGSYEAGDPACGFGRNGKAFSVFLAPGIKGGAEDVLLYRSTDGGKTWAEPSFIDRGVDREFIVVDNTGGKYDGHVYINGTGAMRPMDSHSEMDSGSLGIGISVQRSTDGGETFRPAIRKLSTHPHYVLGMGNGVVLSDGTYVCLYGELKDIARVSEVHPATANAWLKTISSIDGGESFGDAVVVSDFYMNYGEISTTSSIVPVLAVDKSNGPFRDRLYAVWPDFRAGRGQILISHSADKGKSWSVPVVVSDDRAWPAPAHGPDDVMPEVDVNSNGVVGVDWYDRRDNAKNFGWYVRFAVSTDGGETFGPSVRVSDSPATIKLDKQMPVYGSSYGGGKPTSEHKGGDISVRIAYGTLMSFNGGHTAGMAADAGGDFHPFWIDNRTGVQQIWTAAVKVDGTGVKNGSSELAGLDDVSDKVTIDLKNGTFDKRTGILSIDAYLGNTSDVVVKGPLKIRVMKLDSKLGAATIEDSDNQLPGAGAVWDFSSLVPDKLSGLKPGELCAPKTLKFHISSADWGKDLPDASDLQEFISFQSRVFAPKPPASK